MRLLIVPLLAAALALAGCGATAQDLRELSLSIKQRIGQVEASVATLDEAIDQARVDLAELPDDAPLRAELLEGIDRMIEIKAQASTTLATLRTTSAQVAASIDEAGNIDAVALGDAITTGGAALPPPFNAYAGLAGIGVSVLAGLFGLSQKRKADKTDDAAASIVRSIEALKASNPQVATAIKSNKVVARLQTPAARRLVERVQGVTH